MIFTTNVESGRWGTVFSDDKLAAAIVDHVVHQSGLVEFGGVRWAEPQAGGEPDAREAGKVGMHRRARDETRKTFVHGPERNPCSKPKARLD